MKTSNKKTALAKLDRASPESWIDPGIQELARTHFSELFYSGYCDRRLHPVNHWSYQYKIRSYV